jgi:hypothetical protein
MKKVRIYTLRRELSLSSCTPIIEVCQQLGIAGKTPSSTLSRSQSKQVMEVFQIRRNSQVLHSDRQVATPSSGLPSSHPHSNNSAGAGLPTHRAVLSNSDGHFLVEVSGLRGSHVRHGVQRFCVPFSRLSSEVRRVTRAGGRIVEVQPYRT